MKRLLVKADDFGFTDAVSCGILLAHKNGIVKNTAMMVNMPAAVNAAVWIKDYPDLCLGLHTNIVVGTPCADPKMIPGLLREDGHFVSSKVRREQLAKGLDPFSEEEIFIECDAQVDRFIALNGKLPEYLEGHAVGSPKMSQGILRVAQKRGIKILPHHEPSPWALPQFKADHYTFYKTGRPLHEYFTQVLDLSADLTLFVAHPGFVDQEIMTWSSLNLERTLDYALLTDQKVMAYLKEKKIDLISFREV